MAVKDFYAEWLGVTARDRPPNHYQLLGLKEFAGDKGLIEQAARQQRQRLEPFLKGSPDERETAERLVLTLQRAEYVLGDPARKREYDAWLTETREKGAPKTVPLAAVAAEQELLTQRDRAIEQGNWGRAEEVALKLVSFDPQNASHQQVLTEVQARRARGEQKALGLKAVKLLVLVGVLVGLALLVVRVAHRVTSAVETAGATGGAKPHEQRTGPPTSTSAAGAARPSTAGAAPQTDARAEAVTRAEKLLEEKKFAEALAAYQEARTKAGSAGTTAEQGLSSLRDKIDAAKKEARDRAKAAEGRADWAQAVQAYQDLAALGETREAQPHLAAAQAAAQAEQLEKAGKLEEAVAAYNKVAAALVDRTALDAKVAELKKQIETTRPKLKY
jgi:hypothetical protein